MESNAQPNAQTNAHPAHNYAHKRNPLFEIDGFPLKGNLSSISKHTTNMRLIASDDYAQAEVFDYDIDGDVKRGLEMRKIKAEIEQQQKRKHEASKYLRDIIKRCKERSANSSLPPLDDTHNPDNVLAPCPNRPGEQMGFLGGIQAHHYRDERGYDMISFIDHPAFDSAGKYREKPPPTDKKRKRDFA